MTTNHLCSFISLSITVHAIIAAMARSIVTTHPVCSVESRISTSYPCDTNIIVSDLVSIVNMSLHLHYLYLDYTAKHRKSRVGA